MHLKTTRRKFSKVVGSGILGTAAIGFYTWQIEPKWVEYKKISMAIENLPESLVGEYLVHLSDIHIGPRVDSNYIINTLKKVSEIKPRIIVITGDFVSYENDWVLEKLNKVFNNFNTMAPRIYACLGNHDYGDGWSDLLVADKIKNILLRNNIRFLNNQIDTYQGLQIAGFEDYWSPNFSPEKVIKNIDPNLSCISLCHNPDAIDHKLFLKYKGWILAGHTHGGQCKPPFLSPPILPVKNKLYTAGKFKVNEKLLYINRGLGHLLQVRFNVRPEVTIFKLQKA